MGPMAIDHPKRKSREPVQRRGAETRDSILVTARGLFGKRGYDGTSLELLLDAAGVTRGALYHHFAGKQEIFDAVFEEVLAEAAAQLGEGYDPDADPIDCLREGTRGWLRLAVQPEVQRIVLLDAPVVLGSERFRALDQRYFLDGIGRDIARARPAGADQPVDSAMLASLLVAAVNDVALRVAERGGDDTAISQGLAAADLLIDRLVAGG